MEPEITFYQLKKASKQLSPTKEAYKMAILGNCATQHLATAIKGQAHMENLDFGVFDADYNQIEIQTLDVNSELYTYEPDLILLYICAEKLHEEFCETPLAQRDMFAQSQIEKIRTYYDRIERFSKSSILQFDFVEIDDGVFGSYSAKLSFSFSSQMSMLNEMLREEARKRKRVQILPLSFLQNYYGRKAMFDPKFFYIAKMPLSLEILPAVAKQVIDVVKTRMGKFKKCVILDLDNTIWGGVIGDDGLSGIEIGELGTGHAFSDIQRWLKELKQRGIILAVCSKNNEETAKEPFEKHPDMILKLEDISIFVANWEDKASNVRYIQQVLNIGMDSIVFLDDNPFERNLVRNAFKEITVPELPEDPALYLSYLKEQNLFETASYSNEDADRTKQYQAEVGRIQLADKAESFDDYLKSLSMVATAKPFDAFHFSRIAQLTQRSNQFNLRTIRYTESEIEAFASDDRLITLYFTLSDKFGDHGLISVVIMEKRPEQTLFINTWLMSCRVLKRGMEEFIINKIMQEAKKQGFRRVIGEYLPTPKNGMVKDIYGRLGFAFQDGLFVADTESFVPNKTMIQEEL